MSNVSASKATKKLSVAQLELMADLEQSLLEARTQMPARVHTPDQINARRRGRPVGSLKIQPKTPVKLRLDSDVLEALRATGEGWQTRINDSLRAAMQLAGKLNR